MKLKRILTILVAMALLLSALTFSAQAADKPEWVYKYTLWVADVNDAGAPEASVYGYIVLRDDSKIEQSFANAGIKRGATVTKEIKTGYAPWMVKTVGIKNKSDNALCVAGIKLEVKREGQKDGEYTTLLDKYNPKSDKKKWIETQKGSGYDKGFEKGISSVTKRDISAIGNYITQFSGEYTLDVAKTYSNTVTKTWDKQLSDQYLSKYNSKDYSDVPTISYDVSGIALDKTVTINRKSLEQNGFAELDGGNGYSLDMAKILSFMNKKTINKITIASTLKIPVSSLDTGYSAYKKLGGKGDGKFESVYTITRNAFAVTEIKFDEAVKGAEKNNNNNYYYGDENSTVKVSARVKTGGNNNHIAVADIKGKEISFESAKIQLGQDVTALVAASTTTANIGENGEFTLEFPLASGLDSKNVGLTLFLENGKIDLNNGLWLCEEKEEFALGDLSYFASEYKVDTKTPYITFAPLDSVEENGWRKSITLTSSASEDIYSNSGASTYEYELISEKNALSISDKNGGNNFDVVQSAPAANGLNTEVTIALRDKLEAGGDLIIDGCDIAGNRVETVFTGIKLDNLAPRTKMLANEKARMADGSKSIEYSFYIEDASETGRVYYCFTEGLSVTPIFDENNLKKSSDTLDTTAGMWAYVEQGKKAVAVLKCENGNSFSGRLHYFTKDAFGNTSQMQISDVLLLNEDSSCDITATDENTKIPLKDYNISITTTQGNDIFWRWSYPDKEGYVADFRRYSSEIGNGKQIDDSGNVVVLDGSCTLEVKIVTPRGEENTVSRQFVFDNSKPEIGFIARNSGTFRELQTINVKAEDPSQIISASAKVLNADESVVEGVSVIPLNITDGFASHDISLSGLKSGKYCIKVNVTDGNGYTAEKISNPFYIRSSAPDLSLDILSDSVYGESPLISHENYTLSIDVNEPFVAPTDTVQQTLYYRVADDSMKYGAWIAVGNMEIVGNSYSFEGEVDSPVSLSEGENRIYVQTVIAAGSASPDYIGANITATKSITVYYDETAPQYSLSLNDFHTSEAIFGTIVLSDNISGQISLDSSDDNVNVIRLLNENTFSIEVTDNTETELTAIDIAGNETKIPIIIRMIDKEAPTAEIIDFSEAEKGARIDVSAKISVNGADRDTVQFALIPASEAPETIIDDKYFSYSEDAFKYALVSERAGEYTGETDIVYNVSLAGISGEYVIGVRCADSVGNTGDIILTDNTFNPSDAQISADGFTVSPKNAGLRAVVTANFNVPVSVLPQKMITDTMADDLTLEETNIKLAGDYIGSFSRETSFVIEEIGKYMLYAVDELGRGKAIEIDITDDDVSFGNVAQLSVKTVLVEKYFDYENNDEVVLSKSILPDGTWASPEKTYVIESSNNAEIVTRVEITANDTNLYLHDTGEYEDGLIFNEYATRAANELGADAFKTLVYDVSQIIDESTSKAIDKNERIIEVYAYHPESDIDTWQRVRVIVDTIDNTPPNGELTLDPSILKDEDTGEPLSFTMGNVEAQAVFSDPHSGIIEIGLDVFSGTANGYYSVLLTEDYSTEPYRITNEYFQMTVWSDTNPKSTKYVELEFYQNINAELIAENATGFYGYCGMADGLNINYINKVDISDADYTLSYYYADNNGEWQRITDEGIYYRNAKAVVSFTDSGIDRGLYVANNSGNSEKTLNSLDRSFEFVLKDKYGYEIVVDASLTNFDEVPGTIGYKFNVTKKTNVPVPVEINVFDKDSGIGSVALTCGTEQIPLTEREVGTYIGQVSKTGNHVITLLDKAGNKTQRNFMVSNIDSTKPVITEMEYSTEERTAKAVSVKLGFSKPNVTLTKVESTLAETDYSVDYGNSTLRFSENGKIRVWFIDDYGNEGSGYVSVENIYKAPPAVEAVMAVAADTMSVDVSFKKATDETTGVPIDKERELTELTVIYGGIAKRIENENGETAVYSFAQNGIYTFKVYDNEGVSSYITLEITGIDSAAPKITQIRWSYEYYILESGEWKRKTEIGMRDTGDEVGYIMATDIYPMTNQNVSVTAVTDSETVVIGTDGEFATEHTLSYSQNGMYIFNLKKANGLSDSYGVDVELIDKTPPVIEVDSPEVIFYENQSANAVKYSKELLETFAAYDMFGGYKDLSDKVIINYGTFNADDITKNIFDKTKPYTVTYSVSDDAGNEMELKRTVRLVGFFDTVAVVNGALPDYAGRKEINTDIISISLENFSGISYARIAKGVKTLGQMKKFGDVIPEKTQGSGKYEYTVAENGWYTVLVQTDKRDYFNLQIYVQK